MSIGISVVRELRSTNWSQLRKNTRSKGDRECPHNYVKSELRISCVQFFTCFFLLNQGNTLHRGETEETNKLKQFEDMEGSHIEEGKVPDDEAAQTVEVKLPLIEHMKRNYQQVKMIEHMR